MKIVCCRRGLSNCDSSFKLDVLHSCRQVRGRRTSTHIDDITRCRLRDIRQCCSELAQWGAAFAAQRFYIVIFYRQTPSCPAAGTLTDLRRKRTKLSFITPSVTKRFWEDPADKNHATIIQFQLPSRTVCSKHSAITRADSTEQQGLSLWVQRRIKDLLGMW